MSIETHEGPAPADIERADDEIYANTVNALAAVFRIDIAALQRNCSTEGTRFAAILSRVAGLMRDGWEASDAMFPKDVFDQYGPGAVLLALKRAYEQPQPMGELEGD